MPNFIFWQCPQSDRIVFVQLICLALLSSLILIANPGFFNHDELQKVDFVLRYGFIDYLKTHVTLSRGSEFGVPVRPISFLVQGIVSLFQPAYPFLVHLIDVLMHGVVASLLYIAICRVHGGRTFAWTAAIIFLVSPLATFSVGWPAALMDRLYILFGLLAFIAADRYLAHRSDWGALVAIFFASACAILSKETALVLPGILIIYLIYSPGLFKSNRFWTAFGVWSIPVILFLLYRAPALMVSFGGKVATPYSASLENVLPGLLVYTAYPFLVSLAEAGNWSLHAIAQMWTAVSAHLILVILLWRAFGNKAALAYCCGYLFFIVPVLPIWIKGAHYLYGSGLFFALGLAALLALKWNRGKKILVAIPVALLIVSVYHTWRNQVHIYKIGSCMNRALDTMEAAYLGSGKPEKMAILVEPNAPGHVLYRITTGRDQIRSYYPVTFHVVDWDKREKMQSSYIFNSDCLIHHKVDISTK